MMLGNVAPAPLSFTCARAGAASARAAATASRRDFVMVRASSELEIDLRLEQGLRARREVRRVQGVGLEVRVVPVRERSEEHTSELQSRFGISYAVFCLKKKKRQ